MIKAQQFFYAHAGYSYRPETQTPEEGRTKCAKALADAEKHALDEGYSFDWDHDEEPGLWLCSMYDADGSLVDCLGGCDFGKGEGPHGPYRRVVEAEVALGYFDYKGAY